MPIPSDAFFAAWEAELSEDERDRFCRDGVVEEEAWSDAPLRVAFVTAEPNLASDHAGARSAADSRDLRALTRELGGSGSFGVPLARWTAMLLDDAGPEAAATLSPPDRRRQARRTAQINLKKTGGGAAASTRRVTEWSVRHRDRLLEQVRLLDPEVLLLCGGHVLAAWPRLTGDPDAPPLAVGDRRDFEGRPVLGCYHPSAMGKFAARAVKDAPVAAFAASPAVAALRRA